MIAKFYNKFDELHEQSVATALAKSPNREQLKQELGELLAKLSTAEPTEASSPVALLQQVLQVQATGSPLPEGWAAAAVAACDAEPRILAASFEISRRRTFFRSNNTKGMSHAADAIAVIDANG